MYVSASQWRWMKFTFKMYFLKPLVSFSQLMFLLILWKKLLMCFLEVKDNELSCPAHLFSLNLMRVRTASGKIISLKHSHAGADCQTLIPHYFHLLFWVRSKQLKILGHIQGVRSTKMGEDKLTPTLSVLNKTTMSYSYY